MVKTHRHSKFVLKTLESIRDSSDIVLQTEKTDTVFEDSKKVVYLCEVVSPYEYRNEPTLEQLSNEIINANAENRKLRGKLEKMEKMLLKQGGHEPCN